MTLPNINGEAPPGSAEEARRDAEHYGAQAAEQEETATSVVDALNAQTLATLALASRLGQLAATLARPEVGHVVAPDVLARAVEVLDGLGERAQ